MVSFCVLMAVYEKENPEFFAEALESIDNQSVKPNEIILVKDGPIGEDLQKIINTFKSKVSIQEIELPENKGLAAALNVGLLYCNHEYIARMDSDDICENNRFEEQIKYVEACGAEITGSAIKEFYSQNGKNIERIRRYPEAVSNKDVYLYKATPIAHPTLFIKSDLLKKYKYREKTKKNEDIDLWFRMLSDGLIIRNIPEPLLNFRITGTFFDRRGIEKALSELRIYLSYMYEINGFSLNLIWPFMRFIVRLLPCSIKKYLYLSDFRKKIFSLNPLKQVK